MDSLFGNLIIKRALRIHACALGNLLKIFVAGESM